MLWHWIANVLGFFVVFFVFYFSSLIVFSSGGSVFNVYAEEDGESSTAAQHSLENSITMTKMKLLKAKMEDMNLNKKVGSLWDQRKSMKFCHLSDIFYQAEAWYPVCGSEYINLGSIICVCLMRTELSVLRCNALSQSLLLNILCCNVLIFLF